MFCYSQNENISFFLNSLNDLESMHLPESEKQIIFQIMCEKQTPEKLRTVLQEELNNFSGMLLNLLEIFSKEYNDLSDNWLDVDQNQRIITGSDLLQKIVDNENINCDKMLACKVSV